MLTNEERRSRGTLHETPEAQFWMLPDDTMWLDFADSALAKVGSSRADHEGRIFAIVEGLMIDCVVHDREALPGLAEYMDRRKETDLLVKRFRLMLDLLKVADAKALLLAYSATRNNEFKTDETDPEKKSKRSSKPQEKPSA